MPPANHVVLASGAAVAVSVAIASAIALYESPELRRYADDLRRRIAVAVHSAADSINPTTREPLFNRPEDAHGFMQSGQAAGVDADEETRRRQREELMYWNSVRLAKEKENEEKGTNGESDKQKKGTFDDFMRPDAEGEKGSFVYKSGADAKTENETDGLRKRGAGAFYANPFSDEHGISSEELVNEPEKHLALSEKQEEMSDIYSATDAPEPTTPIAEKEPAQPSLIDVQDEAPKTPTTASPATMDNEFDFQTAGQDSESQNEAYASIQAWAQNSSAPGFYSPLPSTPAVPQSEPELVSDGELTPTDSMSLAGSGEDISEEARAAAEERPFDVMSESDGMMTPASWSEVGSVVSESDAPVPARAQ